MILETWLAEFRRTVALSDLGAVFLSLQNQRAGKQMRRYA